MSYFFTEATGCSSRPPSAPTSALSVSAPAAAPIFETETVLVTLLPSTVPRESVRRRADVRCLMLAS